MGNVGEKMIEWDWSKVTIVSGRIPIQFIRDSKTGEKSNETDSSKFKKLINLFRITSNG